jgi:hypothetical protein
MTSDLSSDTTEGGELEGAIWQALHEHKVTVPSAYPLVEDLMRIARAYAAGDSAELTAVLKREGR